MVKCIESLSEFKELLEKAGEHLVVIDFTAVWCGPCKRIAPAFEALSKVYCEVMFYKVDVDDAQEIATDCGIRSMPTFQFYKCQKKVGEFSGADEKALEEKIKELK
ncbi:hypothetical protein FKM82_000509 [Ascaphus truei]|uniref:thioredoxin-like n=1 Tax=Ascaphus truei TaxID=8439 RepID=UPI003F5AAD68